MDFFLGIYQLFLYQPIFNALILISQVFPGKDFGVAVIVLTLLIRLISYPLGAQAVRAQKTLAELQPKIKEVQEKLKNNKAEQTKAMLELYKKEKINPFASFLPILIQVPVFIVLYRIFSKGLHEEQFSKLYSFIPQPEHITPLFLGVVNLNERFFPLALLAGVIQFVQLKQAALKTKKAKTDKPDIASLMQTQMPYVFPVLIVWVASSLPAAFGLYFIATTVFSIWQQWFITRKKQPTPHGI